MKKIVCDLCGESDFVKVSGFFECQVCGAKYTVQEARGMFVDVPDDPKEKVQKVQQVKPTTTQKAPSEAQAAPKETPAVAPKPTIVVKRVVVQTKAPANDSQTVKRIVSNVKTNQAEREVTQQPVNPGKPGTPGTVVRKVVVKKPTPVQQPVQAQPRKVVVQPTPVVAKPGVSVEKNQMIENFFILAQNAFDSRNFVDAENYANRIIEVDPKNSDAWLMKGNCAGWQTANEFRFLESINCWNTCLQNSDKEEFDNYQFTVRANAIDVAIAYVLRNIIDFKKNPGPETITKIKETIDFVEPLMRKANQTFGVDIVVYEDKLASNIGAIVTDVSKSATQAFGKKKEMMTDDAYLKFIATQDYCIEVWSYLMDLAKKHGTVTTILSSIVKMQETIIRAQSYKLSGSKLKDSMKCSAADRNKRLEYIKKSKRKLEDKFVDIRKRDRVEQKFKNEKYWEEHKEEKQELLDERTKLDHEVFELENSKLKMKELTELKRLEEEVIRLQVLKDNPTYSNKERTAFMEEWNKTKKQVITKKRELANRLNPIEDRIEKLQRRILTIDVELNMNR